MHLDDAPDALGLAGKGVEDVGPLLQAAGVDAGEGQGAEAVVHDLEGQGAQRALGIDDGEAAGLVAFQIDLGLRRDLHGVRQVVHDAVQHQLHALVLERGSAEGREEGELDGAAADAALEGVDVRLFAVQVLPIASSSCSRAILDELLAPLLDQVGHVRRRVLDAVLGRVAGVVPDPGLAGQQVHHAGEVALDADGQDHDQGPGRQHVLDLLDHAVEVRADAVELVDQDDAGDLGVVGIAPVGLGLGLDAAGTAEDADTAVEHLQRPIDLDGEVHVSGGVDDVEAMTLPVAGGGGGLDGDAAFLLLHHEVGGGSPVMDLADLVDLAGQLEDALGGGGLTRIDVGEDTDVSVEGEVCGHGWFLGLPSRRGRY